MTGVTFHVYSMEISEDGIWAKSTQRATRSARANARKAISKLLDGDNSVKIDNEVSVSENSPDAESNDKQDLNSDMPDVFVNVEVKVELNDENDDAEANSNANAACNPVPDPVPSARPLQAKTIVAKL